MVVRGILYILIFLVVVAILAKFRSSKVRQAALLAGSCALYLSWGLWFGLVLLASIDHARRNKWCGEEKVVTRGRLSLERAGN